MTFRPPRLGGVKPKKTLLGDPTQNNDLFPTSECRQTTKAALAPTQRKDVIAPIIRKTSTMRNPLEGRLEHPFSQRRSHPASSYAPFTCAAPSPPNIRYLLISPARPNHIWPQSAAVISLPLGGQITPHTSSFPRARADAPSEEERGLGEGASN